MRKQAWGFRHLLEVTQLVDDGFELNISASSVARADPLGELLVSAVRESGHCRDALGAQPFVERKS